MSTLHYTSIDELERIHDALDASFRSGKNRSVAFRKSQLAKLAYMIKDNTTVICQALEKDLHRNPIETLLGDTGIVLNEVVYAFNNVEKWARDTKPETTGAYKLMKLRIKPTPKGVVLIISPFNYPILLTFVPLIGALAAGCTVVLKLPESLESTSPLLANLVSRYLDPSVVRVVQGGVKETTRLLELRWDHILFTGSTRVGKIVATAAAKYNTPTTMELGGKCPVIVDPRKADFAVIATRILWGRVGNGGQACVSPDYILIPRGSQNALVSEIKKAYKKFFPDDPSHSDSLARLVSPEAANRIKGYLDETQGTVAVGGQANTDKQYVQPTVLTDVKGDDSTMQEEIFGPVLSIVPIDNLDAALPFINARPFPLALYVFSHDEAFKTKVAESTRSGSIIFNDVMLHVGAPGLPLGGIGNSGYGQYKGKHGFDTFTHLRSSMETPTWVERFIAFRYPPFTKDKKARALRMTGIRLPFDRHGQSTFRTKLYKLLPALLISALIILAYHRNGKFLGLLLASKWSRSD